MPDKLPQKFLDKLSEFIPSERLDEVLLSFSEEKRVTFRANTIKTSSEELKKGLQTLGFEIEQISWYKDAFILLNKTKSELMETKLYKEGYLYIQNLSSMIPPLALNPRPNETILDMAASPGSKTTQLACFMGNTGTIVANDKSPKRLYRLIANLKEQGVINTKTSAIPGEFLWKRYPEYFDRVLIDAPCTMEGRFTIHQPDSYKDWSPRKIKELSNLQKWLLRSAISCTRVGGTIVYATCAMSPEENEEVVDWVLKRMKEYVILENIEIPHLTGDNGITKWKHKLFSPQLSKTLRIYPTDAFEGFYVARFQKIAPVIFE